MIYNPQYWQRDQRQPFEVYRLINGGYEQQIGESYWMPEIGLGIGRHPYQDGNIWREALYWYDNQGKRYLTPEEQLARYQKRFGALPEYASHIVISGFTIEVIKTVVVDGMVTAIHIIVASVGVDDIESIAAIVGIVSSAGINFVVAAAAIAVVIANFIIRTFKADYIIARFSI